MSEVDFSLISARGDGVRLRTEVQEPGQFTLLTDVSGFGLPVPSVRIDQSASDGGRFRFRRVGPRTMVLPIKVTGVTRTQTETNLRKLASLIRTEKGRPLPRLRAEYSSGRVVELAFAYMSGAEDTYSRSGPNQVIWPLTVDCPQPYWVSSTWDVLGPFGVPDTDVDLLADLAAIPLAASTVLGDVAVSNRGDVEAWPIWEIHGKTSGVSFSSSLGSFQFGETDIGEVITIDSKAGTMVDQTGANVYSRRVGTPRFFPIPSGNSHLMIEAPAAAVGASILGRVRPRYELVH